MKTLHNNYCNSKQGYLPLFLSDCLDLLDPVLTFDRLMGGIDLNKYLTDIPEYTTGRLRYNPVNMLKTVLFGFMTSGYCSLRELEDNCKVNIRFMYLMDHQTPSYRTFGYFINEILQDKIENILNDINHAIFNDEHVDLQHLYIDGSKFEANANKYTLVWKKATEKFRYKLYEKITAEIEEINAEIAWSGVQITTNPEYVPDYLNEIVEQLVLLWELDTSTFVYGSGKRKSKEQRHYEHLTTFCQKLQEYIQKIEICGPNRNSYSKTDNSATFMRIKTDYMGNDQLLPAYNVQIGVADEYIAVVDVNHYRSDMDCFVPLMEHFKQTYGFYVAEKEMYKDITVVLSIFISMLLAILSIITTKDLSKYEPNQQQRIKAVIKETSNAIVFCTAISIFIICVFLIMTAIDFDKYQYLAKGVAVVIYYLLLVLLLNILLIVKRMGKLLS